MGVIREDTREFRLWLMCGLCTDYVRFSGTYWQLVGNKRIYYRFRI